MLKDLINHTVDDPRSSREKAYSLYDILCLSLISIISGETTYVGIEEYGQLNSKELLEYFDIQNIPSHDTIRLIFMRINPDSFVALFNSFLHLLLPERGRQRDIISLDGKTIRNSGKNLLHIVSAWSSENRLILAHQKTSGKGCEIAGLKEVLHYLDMNGHIVTTDALGCQKDITKIIKENAGDYVLQVKKNQANLLQTMQPYFDDKQLSVEETICDKTKGWVQQYTTIVCSDLGFLNETCKHWCSIESIIKVMKTQTKSGVVKKESRYYISSLKTTPQDFHKIIKSHWGIENNVHWTLDVRLNEDRSRISNDNAAENMNILKKISLNIMYSIQKYTGTTNKKITLKSIQRKFSKPQYAKKSFDLLKLSHS